MQVQEAQRVPNRYIIIKMPKIKDKERILKPTREKQLVTYRGIPIRLFSKETMQARMDEQEIFFFESFIFFNSREQTSRQTPTEMESFFFF